MGDSRLYARLRAAWPSGRSFLNGVLGMAVMLVLWHLWQDHAQFHLIITTLNGIATRHPELFR